jgi:MSHA biogenesis protein MshJ
MKQQWEMISAKLEAMSLRERVFIFAALTALLLALINMLLLEPLFVRQKSLRSQLAQQQQMLSAAQSQIAAMQQENSADANSPQLNQIKQLKQEIAEGNAFLQSSRERLVQPEKMAAHLRQLLNKNNRLKIIALQTLPVTTLIEQPDISGNAQAASQEKQIFKHGVQLALRGNYLDLLQYLSALEKLPQQMYWAKAKMSVVEYPASELTLTLYTLSLDKTWLQI